MFERNYSFFHHCLLSCRCVIFQKQYFEKPKGGAQAAVRGAPPPGPPRSDGTVDMATLVGAKQFSCCGALQSL